MFTAIQPIEFIAKAALDQGVLHFETSKALLRFQQLPGHPAFTLPQGQFIDGPWKMNEVAPSPCARMVVLTLHGPTMNELIAQDPDYPLYRAFLDRLTYELPLELGPLPLGQYDPPSCEEPFLLYTLFLKLNVSVW